MKKIMELKDNTFFKNIRTVLIGSAGAQIITFFSTMLISRIYSSETVGIYGTVMSVVNILSPIVTLKLEEAIVINDERSDSIDILNFSIKLSIFNFIVFSVLFFLLNDIIIDVFNLREISSYLYVVPFLLLSSSLLHIMQNWIINEGKFYEKSKAFIIDSLVMNSGKVLFGLVYSSPLILLGMTFVGNLLFVVLLVIFSTSLFVLYDLRKFKSLDYYIGLLKKNYVFPLYRMPQSLIFSLSEGLPILLLTSLFNPAIAGYYSMGSKLLKAPSLLISRSVEDVFFSSFSKKKSGKELLFPFLAKNTLLLSVVGLIVFGGLAVIGPLLFPILLGEGWAITGIYSRWMALWIFSVFISRPSSKALNVLNEQAFLLVFIVFKVIFSSIGILFGALVHNSHILAVQIYSISAFILYVAFTIYALYKANLYDHSKNDMRGFK